ncbi:HDOD domain-containing protein [Motiliproteus sp. SC1-56]|uniref:HDOD domain-containing protein n=1 Tax=Motiliproteus sp. SC1-56 TaxID=2799565 RepID=UPI001A8C6869|nr:HDOD domain-containing protein [Motiliproteus sp. SC1-56]
MPHQPIRIVMLNDSQGKMLVMLPNDQLLNLVSVWKFTGRRLQPVSSTDSHKIFSQPALESDSGRQKLLELPLLVDPDCKLEGTLKLVEPHSERDFEVSASELGAHEICKLGLTPAAIDAKQPKGDDVTVITRAVEKFTALRIKQRLEDTLGLPTLPPTAQKIVELRSDPNSGVDDLVPIVKLDPSLSAQVMSWASSPYYAAPGTIDSINDAVVRVLGYDLVVNLALGIAMGKTLEVPKDTPRGSTPYWLQSVYMATLTEKLVKQMPIATRPKAGLAYLGGLLHNFGYLALSHIFPPHFSLVSRYIEANPHLHHEYVEKQIINVTREQVGAWLMEIWKLPQEVCGAIRYQNDLGYDGEHAVYARLLNLALRVLRQNGIGDGPVGAIPADLYESLGLNPEQVQLAFEQINDKEKELEEMTRLLKAG